MLPLENQETAIRRNSQDNVGQPFFSFTELAKRWRCSRSTVYNRLRAVGAEVLDFAPPNKIRTKGHSLKCGSSDRAAEDEETTVNSACFGALEEGASIRRTYALKKQRICPVIRSLFVPRFHWRVLNALPSRTGSEPGIPLEARHTTK
jgi:hypothetical protein